MAKTYKEYYQENAERLRKRNRKYYRLHRKRILKKSKLRYETRILALKKERGGKCERCGYHRNIKILQFHHYKGKKSFSISSRNRYMSIDKLRKEAKKCKLLCPNCHYEITFPE